MNRQGFLIGFLAGGWLATIGIVLVVAVGLPNVGLGLEDARAEDRRGSPSRLPIPGAPPIGPSVNSPGAIAPRGRN